MDYRVERLRTPAECEIFAQNAKARNFPDLVLQAQRRAIHLHASAHETASSVEAEAYAAVYAYEVLLTRRNGKKTRATAMWQAIRRYGIIEAVERAVSRPTDAAGAVTLETLGFADLAFEEVVMRNEASFSAAAINASKARLAESTPARRST